MSRRIETTPKDPDVEKAREEKEIIEGQKNTLQTEVLDIATTKKELEANFEDAKIRLQEEFDAKKKLLDAEIEKLQNTCVAWRREELVARDAAQVAITQRDLLFIQKDEHHNAVNEVISKKDAVSADHDKLVELKTQLEKDIQVLTQEVSDLEKSKDALISGISTLASKKKEAEKELAQTLSQISIEEDNLKKFQAEKATIFGESKELEKQIGSSKAEIKRLQGEAVDFEKKASDYKAEMKAEEDRINEKMGSLSRLEQYVNEKRDELKEVESRFTSEHLARMGYAKSS